MSTTWINRGHFYVPHVRPILVDCNFLVDATNGLGITNLKGQGISNVFMHTSTTPSAGPNGVVNPNPASGLISVQLSDNFMKYYGGFNSITPPLSGSDVAVLASGAPLTVGVAYTISVLGTSTAADWLAVGVPPGVTPAVGVCFIAIATGSGTGSGKVQIVASGASAIDHIEVIGDPNMSINPIPVGGSPHVGGWITLGCYGKSFTAGAYTPAGTVAAPVLTMASYTPAGTITNGTPDTFAGNAATLTGTNSAPAFTGSAASLTGTIADALTAPAAGSKLRLAFYLSQSSVVVSGE